MKSSPNTQKDHQNHRAATKIRKCPLPNGGVSSEDVRTEHPGEDAD